MEFLATEEACKVLGRSLMVEGTRYLSYSGSSISFTFVGRKASCELFSDAGNWDETLKGWMAVYYDEETEPALRFECEDGTKEYVLFESEEKRQVTVRLERYSEAAFAKCGVKKLWIDTEELLPPPEKKQRKIEIIGDSITCGYGVDDDGEEILETIEDDEEFDKIADIFDDEFADIFYDSDEDSDSDAE